MTKLADKIVAMVQTGNILWLAVIAVLALATKLPKLLELLESHRRAQLVKLLEASNCEHLDQNFKQFLSHEIQREYFFYIARVHIERQGRDKILEVHKEANGNIPFVHFKRALSHIKFEDGQLSVRTTKFDIFISMFSLVVALFFGFIGSAMFMVPAFMRPIGAIQAISLYGMGAFFVAMAIFFAFQTFPLYSAKLIKREMKKYHENAIRPVVDAAAD